MPPSPYVIHLQAVGGIDCIAGGDSRRSVGPGSVLQPPDQCNAACGATMAGPAKPLQCSDLDSPSSVVAQLPRLMYHTRNPAEEGTVPAQQPRFQPHIQPHIQSAEYARRLSRCRDALVENGLDCLLLLPGINFTYLTGLRYARERYRLLAAVVTRQGALAVMGAAFEAAGLASGPVAAEVLTWRDDEDQYRRLASWIEYRCGARCHLALEPTTNFYHLRALQTALPMVQIHDATPVTDDLRAVKSTAEIACLQAAAACTRDRLVGVPELLTEGMTERELATRFGRGAMIQFGLSTASPNAVTGSRVLREGDTIVIDAGDRVEGYRSDLTRTFWFGEPSPRQREIYGIVNEAARAAIDAVRPGAPVEFVDLAARQVIGKAGYGEFFTHRGGHGLGLDFHELPICVRGNKQPLVPGMVLTVEPGIYLPGEFGVRLEDDLLVTETGNELLVERGPLYLE
ncbi:MAG: Xaa-Pro peptidase family protein [bacterium]